MGSSGAITANTWTSVNVTALVTGAGTYNFVMSTTSSTATSFSSRVGTSGAITANTWTQVNVTSLVTGAGTYNFVMATTSNTATSFASREATTAINRPQLVIVTDGGGCTAGAAAGEALLATDCPANTPTPTATPTPTLTPTPSLPDFGIVFVGTWSAAEQAAVLAAASETGKALSAQGAAATAVQAFREVMQGLNGSGVFRQIKFSRITTSPAVCITAKTPTAPDFSANIQCDVNVVMNQYTAVHEFGHVFVGRTTVSGVSSYLTKVENPNGPGGGALEDSNLNHLMGYQGYLLKIGSRLDWQRSNVVTDNGWGDAALWDQTSYYSYDFPDPPTLTPTPLPLRVPKIGPCGEGAPSLPVANGTPFPFQQNPCTFPNWEAISPVGPVAEIEEAAADMFLNWVYWKNANTAFLDKLWRSSTCYPNGCPDPGLSGQVRSTWMNQTMTALFGEFGW